MRLLHSMLDFFVATLLNPLYLYLHAFNIQMNINCGIRGLHRGLCGTSGAGGNMLLRSTWIRFYRLAPQRTHFQGRHFFGSAWNRMEAVRTCRDSTEARRLHKIAQNLKYVSLMLQSTPRASKRFGAIPLGHFFTNALLLDARVLCPWKHTDALP
jgi:hypothetical protein